MNPLGPSRASALGPDLARASEAIASRGGRLGAPLHVLAETGSTNDDAKEGAKDGAPHGAVWLAEAQTRGRGRQGRTWSSPPGENLLFSVVLRVPIPSARVPLVALVAGLAVRDAVAKALTPRAGGGDQDEARVLVKWPNDVVVRSASDPSHRLRKIAGILSEAVLVGARVDHVIVGVGLNVHSRAFPDELAALATSVALELGPGGEPDRAELLADILASLDHDVEHVAQHGLGMVHARLAACDALAGRDVEADDGTLEGVAAGIDSAGNLLVRTAGGVSKVASGEVRLRART